MMRRPFDPRFILLAAVLLPGMGHVLLGAVRRGLMTQLFIVIAALVTWHLAPPAASLVGRLSGGLFVYALSLPEAYRLARVRSLQPASA